MAADGGNFLSIWFLRQMAVWATLLNRHEMAIEYWERIRALRPNDARVYATLAHLHAGAGRRPRAIELLQKSVAMDPAVANSWFNLGYVQQEAGDHEGALASFERCIALDAKFDRAFYGKALSLIKLGRVQEAIAPLKTNTVLQPMSPFGWYQLGHAYARMGDRERVIKVIKKLSGFEPKVAEQLQRETGIDAGYKAPY